MGPVFAPSTIATVGAYVLAWLGVSCFIFVGIQVARSVLRRPR